MPQSLDVAPEFQPLLDAHGLRSLDDLFDWQAGDRLDKPGLESWRQRWRMHLTDAQHQAHTFYLKRFTHPPLCRQWQRWREGQLTRSTAGVEAGNARALAAAGIRAVQAAAFGEQMHGLLETRSCVLLSEAPGESLERWLPSHVPALPGETDPRARRRRLDALARFIARFHDAGFVHRDLYLCHIFYDPQNRDQPDPFCLIDLQRVFRPKWRLRRWVIKDLAALNFSTPADRIGLNERLRFLCRYTRQCSRFGSARTLARSIAAKTDRMIRRQARAAARHA